MEGILLVGGLLLLALLLKRGVAPDDKDALKTYVEKQIDELAGAEVVTTWKETDESINDFCKLYSESGEMAATAAPAGGDILKAVVDLFCKIFQKGNNHYFAVTGEQITRLGNVLALGHSGKPLEAAVCCQMVLPQGVSQAVANEFAAWTIKRDVKFKVYNIVGTTLAGSLSAGKYFVFGKIMTTGEAELLPGFLKSAMSNGESAAQYWRAHSAAIVSPPVVIITKESVMARIDP